jgi:hypothetical protein
MDEFPIYQTVLELINRLPGHNKEAIEEIIVDCISPIIEIITLAISSSLNRKSPGRC